MGHSLGRPTLVSHPRNHAGICGVWPLRMPLQQRKTGLRTVRAWILAHWVSAVLPDLAPRKMSLAILGASSSAPTIHNPIYYWGYSSMVEHWEDSITQEHMRSVQTGALPICMAPSGQRTLCAVLPHLFPKQRALPVLGLFCGCVYTRRMMCSPNRCWTQTSAHLPGEWTKAHGKLHSSPHSPACCGVWAESLTSLPLCRATLGPMWPRTSVHRSSDLGPQLVGDDSLGAHSAALTRLWS